MTSTNPTAASSQNALALASHNVLLLRQKALQEDLINIERQIYDLEGNYIGKDTWCSPLCASSPA